VEAKEGNKQAFDNFSGIFLGVIIGFIIGFLLKEKDKKKLLAFLKEKAGEMGEEGEKLVKKAIEGQSVESSKETTPERRPLRRRFFTRR